MFFSSIKPRRLFNFGWNEERLIKGGAYNETINLYWGGGVGGYLLRGGHLRVHAISKKNGNLTVLIKYRWYIIFTHTFVLQISFHWTVAWSCS